MLESKFQGDTIKMIRKMLPGCIILKNNPNYLQGVPDTIVLWGNRWAAIEFKKSVKAPYQPNQEWYIERMNEMSYATMICPENREMKLDELQRTFRLDRTPRVPVPEPVSLAEVRHRKTEARIPHTAKRPVRKQTA